jgi:hypothetical protein
MGGRGLEQTPLALSRTSISEERGTESGTVADQKSLMDPDFASIVAAWPHLPLAVRSALLAIVTNTVTD